ncbi:MAG: prepilin peptidase [Lachnospiraceae bacterium]|nr:prepilin peptidase [Lachnospiraceae bacterium]
MLALGLMVTAVITDLSTQRVPNELIVLGIITGGYFQLSQYGPWGGLVLLVNILIPFLIMYVIYRIGGIGAGDVKLMMALSAIIGFKAILPIMIYSTFVAGLYALIDLIRSKQLIYRVGLFTRHIGICVSERKIYLYNPVDKEVTEIHFTLCMLCAYVIWIVKEGVM